MDDRIHYSAFNHLISLVDDAEDLVHGVFEKITKEECFEPCPSSCSSTSPYRSFDGCCNNLIQIDNGRAPKKFARVLDPAYDDYKGLPRGSNDTSKLPNPRKVSRVVHRTHQESKSTKASLMLMQFGQFLDHDITFTPHPPGKLLSYVSLLHLNIIIF